MDLQLKLCSRVMATLTYSEGCCCLFRILCNISSAHTNLYSTYDLALHQSACYLLATRVKKEQQSIVFFTAAIRELQPLAQYCALRTQSLVCENPISSFVRSTSILIILVSHNAYHAHIHNSFLWNNYCSP